MNHCNNFFNTILISEMFMEQSFQTFYFENSFCVIITKPLDVLHAKYIRLKLSWLRCYDKAFLLYCLI